MSELASTQQKLNQHLAKWDATIREFSHQISEYGERKADLEHRRAVVKEIAKSENPKISSLASDNLADADNTVYQLHKAYRMAESSIEATRARLKWCQSVADAYRTEISTERANAQIYSQADTAQ